MPICQDVRELKQGQEMGGFGGTLVRGTDRHGGSLLTSLYDSNSPNIGALPPLVEDATNFAGREQDTSSELSLRGVPSGEPGADVNRNHGRHVPGESIRPWTDDSNYLSF